MSEAQVGLDSIRRGVRTTRRRILPAMHFIDTVSDEVDITRLMPVTANGGLLRKQTLSGLEQVLGRLMGVLVGEGYAENAHPRSRGYRVSGNAHLHELLVGINDDLLGLAVDSGRFGDKDTGYGVAALAAINTYHAAHPLPSMKVFPASEVRHTQTYMNYAGTVGLLAVHHIESQELLG